MAGATGSSLPPGPPLPRWLQTLAFLTIPVRFVEACRGRYGDLVTFTTLFDEPFVMVLDPELVKPVLRAPPDQLRGGEVHAGLQPLVGRRSLLLLDGEDHLRQRQLVLPLFHGQSLRAYEGLIREATDRAIDSWPVGKPFPLLPSIRQLTLDVLMRAVFGIEEGGRRQELQRRVQAMKPPTATRLRILALALVGKRFGKRASRRFEERRRLVDELIFGEIDRRRTRPQLGEPQDVLSTLLLARDDHGEAMTDRDIRDELVTLLVAGQSTTAAALAWAFELLLRTPPVLERLRAHVAAGDERYLDAVVKETLRLRTIISGTGRVVADQPFALDGYRIPPGVEINLSIAGIHRREDRYPDPSAFRPERFLGPDAPDTYASLPFGGGTRRCLGASFARFQMVTVIRRVLERAQLAPAGRRPEKGVWKAEKVWREIMVPTVPMPKHGTRVLQRTPPKPVPPEGGKQSAGSPRSMSPA
jgi:cytochrome P450